VWDDTLCLGRRLEIMKWSVSDTVIIRLGYALDTDYKMECVLDTVIIIWSVFWKMQCACRKYLVII
jgi:hypothetical protein